MADIQKYAPKLWRLEGGFVDDPDDHGGATNHGVTLDTYVAYCIIFFNIIINMIIFI